MSQKLHKIISENYFLIDDRKITIPFIDKLFVTDQHDGVAMHS